MAKAILIDPFLPAISTVEVDGFEDIQRMIDCRCFTCVRFPDGKHVAYVDDEGLINDTRGGVRFIDEIYPDALAGRIPGSYKHLTLPTTLSARLAVVVLRTA